MTVTVGPDKKGSATHHIKLTPSTGDAIGLICCNGRGDRLAQVAVNPYPNMASQLRQGRGKHADRVPPFEDIPLSDFSGGLAMLHHDEDASKYLDGCRIDTSRMGEVIHGGLETYTKGIRNFDQLWPGDVDWFAMYTGGTTSKTVSFVAGASYNVNSIVVILKKVGAPTGNVTVSLRDSAGDLLSANSTKALTIGTDCLTDLVSERVEFTFPAVQAITATTTYKVQVDYAGGSATAYVQVAVNASANPYYRVLDDTAPFKMLYFEYHGAFYGITQPDAMTASKLYLLGYRGVADANTGALTTLVDAGATFATNEISLVSIVGGPGSDEEQPWRNVSSNNGTTITVSPAWNIEHTTQTEYVAYSNRWKLLQTFAKYVTDVAVVGRHVFFAFGSAQDHQRYRSYNASGTFTEELTAAEITKLHKILAYKMEMPNEEVIGGELWGYYASDATYSNIDSPRRRLYRFSIPYVPGAVFPDHGVLVPSGAIWDETVIANCNHYNYNGMSAITVLAGFATGDVAHYKLASAMDIRGSEYIGFYAYSGVALSAGDWEIGIADGAAGRTNIDLPALAAGEWTWVKIELDPQPSQNSTPDYSNITDLYLQQDVDKGAMDFYIRNGWGIHLVGDDFNPEREYFLPDFIKVNKLIAYIGGSGQPAAKPWLITTEGLFYREGETIVPVVLDELSELAHPRTGEGATVNDVYLYFNAGETIQRYYAGRMDSVGPDADYGLPANRRGIPCSMATYPGKVLSCIDAGSTGYSSVIYRRSHGWHELYRAPYSERIRSIHVVGYTGQPDRVFVSEGSDVLSVPISINPKTEDGYEYTYESTLETSRIYGGLRETEKYYHAISLVTEDLSSTHQYINVDYRTSESSTWVPISTTFVTSPRQNQSLISTNNVSGRWIQFRFRSYTDDKTKTPKLVSAVIDSLERLNVNNMYSYTVRLDKSKGRDMQGTEESLTGVAKLAQLETWVDSPLPLTLNSNSSFEDNKLVFLEGITKRVAHNKPDDMDEVRIINLNLIEVS